MSAARTPGQAFRRLASAIATLPATTSAATLLAATVVVPGVVVTTAATHPASALAAPAPAVSAAARPVCTITTSRWKGVPRFYTTDTSCYTSPWFPGARRIMIGYGCNNSPWYSRTALCPHARGFHHGVDFDMPVGTPIRSAVSGTVVISSRLVGPAYGTHSVLIRTGGHDILLAHLSRRAVHDGQHVHPGQLIGWSGMSGVENEDGPHLHFEVRPAGRGYLSSVNPWSWTHAHRVR